MRKLDVFRPLVLIVTVHAFVGWDSSAIAANADGPGSVARLSWTKTCDKGVGDAGKRVCSTGAEAWNRLDRSFVAGIAIVGPEGEARRIVRVTFPVAMQIRYGTRLVIDDTVQRGAYRSCSATRCVSDYEVDSETLQKIRTGKVVFVQAIEPSGAVATVMWSLADFAATDDGPPLDAPLVEARKQRALVWHDDRLWPVR